MAVLSDEQNNLVIAGAGSGKTLTISGKVKYLIETKKATSDEILLISFTDKAVKEMTERLKRIDIELNAKTFHKLGLEIITNFKQIRPQIASSDFLNSVVSNYFNHIILNFPEQIKYVLEFMTAYLYIPDDISNFKNMGDFIDNFRNIDYETLESKYLKSFEINNPNFEKIKNNFGKKVRRIDDLLIANFLFLNNISYKYDYPYPHKIKNSFKSTIKTNFFLPDYNIHLEHFSIDEKGRSKFLTKYEEQKYLAEIELKRSVHALYKTNLIETYSYYNKNKSLIPNLKSLLLSQNINLVPADFKDIYKRIYIYQKDKQFEEFIKLITTFLSLFKSNNFQLVDIDRILSENSTLDNTFLKNRNELFIKIFKNFYDFYESSLSSSGQIDFNDMINKSTEIINLGFVFVNYC